MNTFKSSSWTLTFTLPDSSINRFLESPSGHRCRAMLGDASAQRLVRSVFLACAANMRNLSPARKHSSRDLCGAEYWAPLSRGLKSCAGLCTAFMERNQDLPLQLHKTRRGKGSKTYWIK